MSKMFQISEADLAELEAVLPRLVDSLYPRMDNRTRAQVRRVQRVIVDVRWNYGPPSQVEVIDGDGDGDGDVDVAGSGA